MPTSVNLGSQIIGLHYKHEAVSATWNVQHRDIFCPGIYRGLTCTITSGNIYTISAGKMWINVPFTADTLAVSVLFQSSITGQIAASATPVLYFRMEWQNASLNFAEFVQGTWTDVANDISAGLHPVIISEAQFSGPTLTGFSYTNRTRGTLDADNSYALTTTVSPSQDYHVGNRSYNDARYSDIGQNNIGFVNRTDSTLTFDNTGSTITLAPAITSFDTYDAGIKRTIPATLGTHAAQAGSRWLQLANGADTYVDNATVDMTKRIVSYYYYNATSPVKFVIQGDSRHGSTRDVIWHQKHKDEVGMTMPAAPTLTYTLNNDSAIQVGVSSPVNAYDADLTITATQDATPTLPFEQVLTSPADIPVVYLDGAALAQDNPTAGHFPWKMGSSNIAYNSVGAQADVPSGSYVNYWLIMTNCQQYPVKMVQGKIVYASAIAAQAEVFNYMPEMSECFVIAQFVLHCDSSFTNNTYRIKIDTVYLPPRALGTSSSQKAMVHNTLSGRDTASSHPALAVSLDTPAGMTSTDVQGGMEELNTRTVAQLTTHMSNTKLTVSGNTLTFDVGSGTIGANNPISIAVPSTTSGGMVYRTLTSAISMTLPSSTIDTRICGINTQDGQATYASAGVPNNGTATGIEWFLYYIYAATEGVDCIGISKSPLHTSVPADYFHSPSATTLTGAGAAITEWDTMILSHSGTVTTANATCVCLGSAISATVSGGSSNAGWFSSITILSGYVPIWNDRKPKTRSEFLSNGPANSITYGSTDTKIRKLATTVINLVGSKMQYFSAGGTSAPGGVGGAEFVATVSGYYHIDYYDTAGTGSSFHGLSLNSAQRTTSIDAITGLNKLAISGGTSGPVTGNPSYCAVSRWFDAGDIIRPHSYGTAGSAIEQIFYMTFRGFE
jgi:hypothetical protein